MTNDMRQVTAPKSDQLNADDLLGGPRTITITQVSLSPGSEQPISVGFEGDDGKPYKPCKSMARLMMAAWGPNASLYGGRSLTLYNDPTVKWGGIAVGGIRISHMSHIEKDMTVALTATRGKKSPYTVKALSAHSSDADTARQALAQATTLEELRLAWSNKAMAPYREQLGDYLAQRKAELSFDDNQSEQPPAASSASQQEDDVRLAAGSQEGADAGAAPDTGGAREAMFQEWRDRIAAAELVIDVSKVRADFEAQAEFLPDEIVAEFEGLLTAATYKLTSKGE